MYLRLCHICCVFFGNSNIKNQTTKLKKYCNRYLRKCVGVRRTMVNIRMDCIELMTISEQKKKNDF